MNYSNHRKFITSILNNLKYNRKLCIQSQSLELESQVRKSLRSVIEPISNQPILSLGCVKVCGLSFLQIIYHLLFP